MKHVNNVSPKKFPGLLLFLHILIMLLIHTVLYCIIWRIKLLQLLSFFKGIMPHDLQEQIQLRIVGLTSRLLVFSWRWSPDFGGGCQFRALWTGFWLLAISLGVPPGSKLALDHAQKMGPQILESLCVSSVMSLTSRCFTVMAMLVCATGKGDRCMHPTNRR